MHDRARLEATLLDILLAKAGLSQSRTEDPILQRECSAVAPLSFAQERLWFLAQMDPLGTTYNISFAVHLEGWLDVQALTRALEHVVQRHEVLRSVFVMRDGEVMQEFLSESAFTVTMLDLQSHAATERKRIALEIIGTQARQRFDLARGPLCKATLVMLAPAEHILHVVMHHIVADNWSYGVLVRETRALYEAFREGRPPRLAPMPIQYADFAKWQRQQLTGSYLQSLLAYWRSQLGEPLPVLKLPTDYPRLSSTGRVGARHAFRLGEALVHGLKELGRMANTTLFMTVLAGLGVLLRGYAGQEQVVIGVPVANRNRPETANLIGYFVNALVIRIDLSGDPDFREVLSRVREVALGAYAHQDLPFEKLTQEMWTRRDQDQTPFFDVVLNFQNAPAASLELPGLKLTPVNIDTGTTKYDLTFYMWEAAGYLECLIVYRADLFRPATLARMQADLEQVLARAIEDPGAHLRVLSCALTRPDAGQQATTTDTSLTARAFTRRAARPVPRAVVRSRYLGSTPSMPLVLEPDFRGIDFVGWARDNSVWIGAELLKHGAVLLRNSGLDSPEAFREFALSTAGELMECREHIVPRIAVGDRLYIDAEYSPGHSVSLHNELSYAYEWPRQLFLACLHAPQLGGEMLLANGRQVLESLGWHTRERFIQAGVAYLRDLQEDSRRGLTWQTVFSQQERAPVEKYCRENEIDFEWKADGGMRTRQVRPAVILHPETGDAVWFCQASWWHELQAKQYAGTPRGDGRADNAPLLSSYSDGTPIEVTAFKEIETAYRQAAVKCAWQQGDILLLDNVLVAHGRMPSAGSHKTLVAMGAPVRLDKVSSPGRSHS